MSRMSTETRPLDVYGFWRSNAMYRVRVALNLKGVPYNEIPVNLDTGEQHTAEFLARNPQAAVPALIEDDLPALTQSLAILEYLEERYPEPPILPADPRGRARVRALACNVACDTHPLIVPRVRTYLMKEAGFDQAAFRRWLAHWVGRGLNGLEASLSGSRETGRFCHGDRVTMADICVTGLAIIPRVFKLDVPATPTVTRIVDSCLAEPAFAKADPMQQPDAPKAA